MLVVLLIALLVIKPEQLPDVALTLGRFAKTITRLFAKVKDEMNGFIEATDKPSVDNKQQTEDKLG